MTATLSGLPAIPTYLSIIKDEQTQVARYVKATPAVQRTVSAFQSDTVSISNPADLLASKNKAALQVVLGAYGLSGQATQTGILRQLLTQDPSQSHSLVRQLGNSADLNFVKATTARSTIALNFGDAGTSSFTAGGSAASQVSVNNLAWAAANSALTSASPAQSWNYVLDDGTGTSSIAAALTKALQGTSTALNPVTASYTMAADGSIVGSVGAPQITTSKDSAGNSVYSITLASDGKKAALRIASVIAVKVPAGTTTPTALSAGVATALLSKALGATGFNIVSPGATSLSIVNPITNSKLSVSPVSFSTFAATAPNDIVLKQTVVPLGSAGIGLSAGQVLLSSGNQIGTIKSVDVLGNVTLTAPATGIAFKGGRIDVAIGAGVSNVGTQVTATSAVLSGSTRLALGAPGLALKAGQTLTDGTAVLGIVKSVDAAGNVQLTAGTSSAVRAGDSLGVLPQITDSTTAAFKDAGNVQTILQQYETSQYEAAQGNSTPGMTDALYFTRVMPTITNVNQLMSDPALLRVVTSSLGVDPTTFGNLPFNEQQSLLTKKVDFASFSKPATVQRFAEQYLAQISAQNAGSSTSGDPAVTVLNGAIGGGSGTTLDAALFSALYPTSGTNKYGLSGLMGAVFA